MKKQYQFPKGTTPAQAKMVNEQINHAGNMVTYDIEKFKEELSGVQKFKDVDTALSISELPDDFDFERKPLQVLSFDLNLPFQIVAYSENETKAIEIYKSEGNSITTNEVKISEFSAARFSSDTLLISNPEIYTGEKAITMRLPYFDSYQNTAEKHESNNTPEVPMKIEETPHLVESEIIDGKLFFKSESVVVVNDFIPDPAKFKEEPKPERSVAPAAEKKSKGRPKKASKE